MFYRKETDEFEVKVNELRTYQYIKIGSTGRGWYFCLKQNPLIFAWLLFFKKDTLDLIFTPWVKKTSLGWKLDYVRYCYNVCINNLKTLLFFVRRQRKLQPTDSIVHLPLYGQLCIPVHRGYKIFDFHKGVVAKVFDADVKSSSILNEIERMKKISAIDFAPSLKRWDVKERWYEEEYVSGISNESSQKRLDSEILLKKFYHDVSPCLESLILLQNPMAKNSIEYINEILRVLEVGRVSRQESSVKDFNKIKSFLDSMAQRLRVEGNCLVQLVFTHGDFCPANMLNAKHGIRVIDWEGATFRSALFDFYSYFFYRPACRKVPISQFAFEISEALPSFISSLEEKAPEIYHDLLHFEKVYRWVYYIEQVCVELKRSMTYTQLNLIDCILRYIDAFNLYEDLIAGNVDQLSSKAQA